MDLRTTNDSIWDSVTLGQRLNTESLTWIASIGQTRMSTADSGLYVGTYLHLFAPDYDMRDAIGNFIDQVVLCDLSVRSSMPTK